MARLYMVFGLVAFPLFSCAQVQKVRMPLQVRAGLELEWDASEKNTFYLDHQWRHSGLQSDYYLAKTGILSSIEKIRFTLGYERTLTPNWGVEVAQRVSLEKDETKWYNRVMLNYTRNLNKTELEGRLLAEHIRAKNNTTENTRLKPENRTRGNIGLKRPFQIRNHKFELAAETEALFNLSPKPEVKPRLVDRTRLELGITYKFNQCLELTVFGIRQVEYETILEKEQEGNTQNNRVYKRNIFTPILGLELEINVAKK